MADHRETEGQIKPCWEESNTFPSHEDLGKSVCTKVMFCHFRQLLWVPQSSLLLRQCCFETKETVQERQPKNPPHFPFSQDFGCCIGCPGPCGKEDASGGVEQMLSPSTGAKNAPVTL